MKKDSQKSQIIIYKTENGQTKIDVRFDGGTVWLTQNMLAELFQTTKQNISQHIKGSTSKSVYNSRALRRVKGLKSACGHRFPHS